MPQPEEYQPRALTTEEVRTLFVEHVRGIVAYWQHTVAGGLVPPQEAVRGVAFSLLVALDGGSADMPAFMVAPYPHPDDKRHRQARGDNWWPENHGADITADISGGLHDLFSAKERDPMPQPESQPMTEPELLQMIRAAYRAGTELPAVLEWIDWQGKPQHLQLSGRPVVDGIEHDVMWHGTGWTATLRWHTDGAGPEWIGDMIRPPRASTTEISGFIPAPEPT